MTEQATRRFRLQVRGVKRRGLEEGRGDEIYLWWKRWTHGGVPTYKTWEPDGQNDDTLVVCPDGRTVDIATPNVWVWHPTRGCYRKASKNLWTPAMAADNLAHIVRIRLYEKDGGRGNLFDPDDVLGEVRVKFTRHHHSGPGVYLNASLYVHDSLSSRPDRARFADASSKKTPQIEFFGHDTDYTVQIQLRDLGVDPPPAGDGTAIPWEWEPNGLQDQFYARYLPGV